MKDSHKNVDADLAAAILIVDPKAEWVYNKYCRACGRYLYGNDECSKCKVVAADHIKRPIPFTTSGTAIEKLIIWIKTNAVERSEFLGLLNIIRDELYGWLYNRSDDYKLKISIGVLNWLSILNHALPI